MSLLSLFMYCSEENLHFIVWVPLSGKRFCKKQNKTKRNKNARSRCIAFCYLYSKVKEIKQEPESSDADFSGDDRNKSKKKQ